MNDKGPSPQNKFSSMVSDEEQVPPLALKEDFPTPSFEQWRQLVEKDLKGADYDKKLVWKTLEGIDVQPIYTREDLKDLEYTGDSPGFPPYKRGTSPLSGVRPPWQIRQDCQLPTPEDVNAALRDGIARGQTAIGIRLDNAVRRGLDGDSPEAHDLSGRGGCTLSSINGLRIALQDIDLERRPITIRSGGAALPTLAMLVALADERKVNRRMLTGAFECDPLRMLLKTGRVRGSLELQYREMAEIVTFCAQECPGIRGVMVSAHVQHRAGASAVQEVATAMATGAEYIRALMERGIDADTACLGMVFSMSASTNLFMEIAKFRAARMLWAKIAKSFGATNEDAHKMFLHVRTSFRTKTVHDPYNNIVRSSIEAFAGGVGGCDSMNVMPFDDTVGRPDEFSARVARNQQILLQEEAYLSRVVDPAGGSYYVEALTDAVAREAWKQFQEIEGQGGFVKALIAGTPQKAITEVREKRMAMVETRREPIVGTSSYPNSKEKLLEKKPLPREEFLRRRRERLARLKSIRKNSTVRALLASLTNAMLEEHPGTAVEVAVIAAREGATVGEMVQALTASTDGESPEIELLPSLRIAEPYEKMRERSRLYAAKSGAAPKVFLVPTGPLTMRRARADFSLGFFEAGGFDVEERAAFKDAKEAAKAAAGSDALVAVVCSDDATYPDFVPALIENLRAENAKMLVYVAGYPKESIEALQAAGVNGFIHIRSNVVKELTALQDKLGIGAQ